MELGCDDLTSLIGNQLSVDAIRYSAAELFSAVSYMHSNNIIHRDLKPENIIIGKDGHLKITDFGSAFQTVKNDGNISQENKIIDGDESQVSNFAGSPLYVSPEVLQDEMATEKSDLWALGCILYFMFAGEPPFKAATEFLLFEKILNVDYSFKRKKRRQTKQKDLKNLIQHNHYGGLYLRAILYQTIKEAPNQDPYHYHSINSQEAIFQSNDRKRFQQFLMPDGEIIIHTSLILKRVGLMAKERQLILTTLPRLFYVDLSTMKQKGEIPWSNENMRAECKDSKRFLIHAGLFKRTYHLEDKHHQASLWVNLINQLKDKRNLLLVQTYLMKQIYGELQSDSK
ncbi:MAG: putative 3-phosphoinositide-dependent protein kinase 1 [Streblomastix strix]|uniref:non-specific serine/threonine protein kinase n=1 Tax=Streblomastix strix TaxID=222440 RepID=A0A5J4WK38_9EUKA|nr:MAG: putative 3-phosphoinositide-dependent protein kinase 1 [Streblomastix strix]